MPGQESSLSAAGFASGSDTFEQLIDAALGSLPPQQAHDFQFDTKGYQKKAIDVEMLGQSARSRGLEVLRLAPLFQLIRSETLTLGFFKNMPWTLSALDRNVTNDKQLTKRILAEHGLPVAAGEVVDNLDSALPVFNRIGSPVVVKPLTGSGGKGVTVDVRTETQLRDAVEFAFVHSGQVLVEECITSIDLRVFVVAGRAVAAMMRVPAHVNGDGRSTIAELVQAKNALRARNPYHSGSLIEVNDGTLQRLTDRGVSLKSIPEIGQRVFLHYKANMSSGGDGIDVTEHIHPDIAHLAERAAACFGTVHHAGIDVLLQQFDGSLRGQRSVICEVNCNNDVPIHEFPHAGEPWPSCDMEVDGYFFSGKDRVPRVAEHRVRPHLTTLNPLGRVTRWFGRSPDVELPDADWMARQLVLRPTSPSAHPESRSPRQIDQHRLREALGEHQWHNVRYDRKLIIATLAGQDVVVERSRRSIFGAQLSTARKALEGLLGTTSIPFCRRETFDRGDLVAARKLFHTHPGPWILRAASSRLRIRPSTGIRQARALEQAWNRIASRTTRLTLEQAPEGYGWRLLLSGGQIISALGLCPPSVTGNGEATIADLTAQVTARREAHPYLRHYPLPPSTPSKAYLARQQVSRLAVLDVGASVRLSATTHVSHGAETVGYRGEIESSVLRYLDELMPSIGHPQLVAVTFARRKDSAEQRWALFDVDVDPILAEFALPAAGETFDVYRDVAALLVAGQRYTLSPDI